MTTTLTKNHLRIANSRGRKPVIRDIKKARNILNDLMVELNDSKGRDNLENCIAILWDILEDNKD